MAEDARTAPTDEDQDVPLEGDSLIRLLTKETGQASWISALDEHKHKTLAVFAQLQTSYLNMHETLKKVGGALSSVRNTDSAISQARTRQLSKGLKVVVRKANAKLQVDVSTDHNYDETPDANDGASLDVCRDYQHRHCKRNNCKFAHR